MIHNGQRQEFVFGYQPCRLLLIHGDLSAYGISNHHLTEGPLPGRDDQGSDGDDAKELTGFIYHVEVEKSLQLSSLTDPVYSSLGCSIRREGQKFGGHDPPDGSLRKANELFNSLSSVRIHQGQDPLSPLFRQALNESHLIIRVCPDQHLCEFYVFDEIQDLRQQVWRKFH